MHGFLYKGVASNAAIVDKTSTIFPFRALMKMVVCDAIRLEFALLSLSCRVSVLKQTVFNYSAILLCKFFFINVKRALEIVNFLSDNYTNVVFVKKHVTL